jgi:hypothetical protein
MLGLSRFIVCKIIILRTDNFAKYKVAVEMHETAIDASSATAQTLEAILPMSQQPLKVIAAMLTQ